MTTITTTRPDPAGSSGAVARPGDRGTPRTIVVRGWYDPDGAAWEPTPEPAAKADTVREATRYPLEPRIDDR